jgi:phenylpyruvate tautomerase PptA (4-oxalocrotonate tautomerase family)
MPLARISVPAGKSADYRKTVGDVVYEAMLPTLKAPEGDRFQIVTEHSPNDLILDPNYLGISRTKDAIILQLTLREGRTVEQKKDFFKAVADGLHDRLKVRREDVFINLVETKKEDWSFGNGVAQYVQ